MKRITILALITLLILTLTGCIKQGEKIDINDEDDIPAGLIELSEDEKNLITSVRTSLREVVPVFTNEDINLPKSTLNEDISIEWSSSNPTVISHEGEVFLQTSLSSSYLEATIKYKSYEFKERIRVNVYPFNNSEKIDYNKKYTFAYLYGDPGSFDLDNIEKIDYINYSFAKINSAGKIYIESITGLTNVLKLKEHGMKVVLSIGGWGADGFSDAVYTAESRKIFIESILTAVKQYGLSGIDLDWEYPGVAAGGIKARPEDKQNFTKFINELKAALIEYDPNQILTIAVGGSVGLLEIPKIEKALDFIHLMTYDLTNANAGQAAVHLTNLYTNLGYTSVDKFVNDYSRGGFPKNKLIIGIAFYGHIHKVEANKTNGLGAKIKDRNSLSYNLLSSYITSEKFQYYFDDIAKAPWLYNAEDQIFITYDDPTSIKYKCEYVLAQDLGGVMFWQYTHDSSNTLLDAIYNNLKLKG